MEDYNKVSFKDMVSAKIQKKDSERGDIQGTGFPIHGGKPIKELYRTVYTGGPGCPGEQYMKEPVMEIHHTTTNDEGVSQKTMKSTEVEAEHSEKSIRDMVADRNITGFVKTNGTGIGSIRHDVAEGKIGEAIRNKQPYDELDEASEDAWKQKMGDIGDDGEPRVIDEETGYIESVPTPNNPHMTEEYVRQIPPMVATEKDALLPTNNSTGIGNAVKRMVVANKLAEGKPSMEEAVNQARADMNDSAALDRLEGPPVQHKDFY